MRFYLGTHLPNWLGLANFPLFISRRRLAGRRTFPKALVPWALDSGGFSELSMYGEWRTEPTQYVDEVLQYKEQIGNLDWAAPQDWMCEPWMIAKTNLTIAEHQHRTLNNFLWLRERLGSLVIPVLQGWQLPHYIIHAEMYERAGIHLEDETTVGLGSVCRRQHTDEIAAIVQQFSHLNLHGFGIKTQGMAKYQHLLQSADSLSWSFTARRLQRPMCGSLTHKNCANCLTYATDWRSRLLR